jgi:transporter family-2 protein
MLVGQVFFGIMSDAFGWFGLHRRPLSFGNVLVMILILSGSLLIVFGKAPRFTTLRWDSFF